MKNKKGTNPKIIKMTKFGQFLTALKGYDLYFKGRLVEKWQAFHLIDDNHKSILNGTTQIQTFLTRPHLIGEQN